jgi:phage terminase Nu1 subunit (DNA packaging protein)
MLARDHTFSRGDLAALLGVSRSYVSRLARDGTIAAAARGRYPAAAVAQYIAFLESGRPAVSAATRSKIEETRRRMLAARTAKAELEIAAAEGALMPLADVERRWLDKGMRMKQRMLSIPSRAAPLVAVQSDPAAAEAVVRRLVEEALAELDA